ncbi:MAG TPA: autotransporter domain-containing protein [Methylomirabilota bacterium]
MPSGSKEPLTRARGWWRSSGTASSLALLLVLACLPRPATAQSTPFASFFFCQPTYTVNENGGSVTVEIPLVASVGGTVSGDTVDVVVAGGTATRGVDYTLASRVTLPIASPTRRTVVIPITADNLIEGNETIVLSLSNPQGTFSPFSNPSQVIPITLASPSSLVLSDCDSSNPITTTVTIVDVAPAAGALNVAVVSGNNQIGTPNRPLAAPLVARVADPAGTPASGVLLTWSSNKPGDSFSPTSSTTSSNGQASTVMTLGPDPGERTITATISAGSSTTFSVNGGFTAVALTPAQQGVANALDRGCAVATGAFRARCDQIAALPDAEKRNALQQLAPEAVATQARIGIEGNTVQSTNIGLRLASLRSGATGINITGLSLALSSDSVSGSFASPFLPAPMLRGGGASADATPLERLGIFINGQGAFGDRDTTSRELGFKFHTKGITGGADYRVTENFIVGAALGYLDSASELDAGAGSLDTRGFTLSAFGTYYVTDRFYLDGIVSFGWNEYDTRRRIVFTGVDTTTKGDTSGTQFGFSVNGGYNFNFGAFTVGPHLRLDYVRIEIDSYTERGDDVASLLKIRSQSVTSLTTALGMQAAYAISTPWGIVSPNLRLEWEHQFENSRRQILASFVADPLQTPFGVPTDDPDRDYFNLGAGVAMTFKKGVSSFLFYETVLGQTHTTVHQFTAGLRLEF